MTMKTVEVSFSIPEPLLYKLNAQSKEMGLSRFTAEAVVKALTNIDIDWPSYEGYD